MKRIRFAVFLPLVHLAIATPPMLIREAEAWKLAPIAQERLDGEQKHPVDAARLVAEPCYEYRASNPSRIIFAANLPTVLLIGTADGCPQSALDRALDWERLGISLKSAITLRGSLIVLGVIAQWWLVGRWLDKRRQQMSRTWQWSTPVAIITVAGAVMLPTASSSGEGAYLVNAASGGLAFLAWIALLSMFLASGVAWVIKKIGEHGPRITNSRA